MELKELPLNGLITSLYGFDSEYRNMKYGVPQGSVLGPLFFLIYINDLRDGIKSSTVHHFVDDTNLLAFQCIKSVQIQINLDLKSISSFGGDHF